eukprot:scaffold10159_cov22-Tisochrysis_lutea.AAC.2
MPPSAHRVTATAPPTARTDAGQPVHLSGWPAVLGSLPAHHGAPVPRVLQPPAGCMRVCVYVR